jgi:hypothetical protein
MKLKDVAVATVWIIVLAVTFSQGIVLGHLQTPPGTAAPFPPIKVWFVALPLLFIFSSTGTFLVNRLGHIPEGWLRYLIDRTWGPGACQEFLVRFRPRALMMLACLLFGVTGLVSTYTNAQNSGAYFVSAFFLSCGLGLLLAYFLSVRLPPRLY